MRTVVHTGSQLVLAGDARGVAIECLDGNLWVTQEGDPVDHVLASGERLVVDRKGRVVVSSLLEADVAVSGGRKALGLRRWSARLTVTGRPAAGVRPARQRRAA